MNSTYQAWLLAYSVRQHRHHNVRTSAAVVLRCCLSDMRAQSVAAFGFCWFLQGLVSQTVRCPAVSKERIRSTIFSLWHCTAGDNLSIQVPEDSNTTLLVSDGWDGRHEVRAGPGRHLQVRGMYVLMLTCSAVIECLNDRQVAGLLDSSSFKPGGSCLHAVGWARAPHCNVVRHDVGEQLVSICSGHAVIVPFMQMPITGLAVSPAAASQAWGGLLAAGGR